MDQLIRALGHLACGFVADAGCGVTVASREVGEILMGIHSPQCTEHRAMISSVGPIWWGGCVCLDQDPRGPLDGWVFMCTAQADG